MIQPRIEILTRASCVGRMLLNTGSSGGSGGGSGGEPALTGVRRLPAVKREPTAVSTGAFAPSTRTNHSAAPSRAFAHKNFHSYYHFISFHFQLSPILNSSIFETELTENWPKIDRKLTENWSRMGWKGNEIRYRLCSQLGKSTTRSLFNHPITTHSLSKLTLPYATTHFSAHRLSNHPVSPSLFLRPLSHPLHRPRSRRHRSCQFVSNVTVSKVTSCQVTVISKNVKHDHFLKILVDTSLTPPPLLPPHPPPPPPNKEILGNSLELSHHVISFAYFHFQTLFIEIIRFYTQDNRVGIIQSSY